MKIFSFHAFSLIYTACLRKKLVSCPDNVLFFLSGSVVLKWRRFCILDAKLGDEGEIVFIPYNFIRIVLFVSLKNADDV